MINNLDKIESPELVSNIKSLYNNILNKVTTSTDTPEKIHVDLNFIIFNSVLGIGNPICICDGYIYSSNYEINYECCLIVNSEVMYLYKPYQKIADPIQLSFTIDIRDVKLNKILG